MIRSGVRLRDPTRVRLGAPGDTLGGMNGMVTNLDRLARSVKDARDIAEELTAKGHLRGKQPKLSTTQRKLLFDLQDRGEYTQTEIAELFNVSRATVYRELQRRRVTFRATCQAHIY